MKFRKLLAGAAVAALTAGSASALDVVLGTAGVGTPAGVIEMPVGLALEGNNLTTAGSSNALNEGVFVLDVITDADIASAGNYIIGVAVTGGEFSRNVVAADLLAGDGSGPTGNPTTFTGATVQFDGTDRTGEDGDTAVRFLASADAGAGGDGGSDFRIVVPIETDCTTPVTFLVSLRTEGGTPIEEGSSSLADGIGPMASAVNAVTCVEAFSASIASDVVPGPSPTDNDSFLTVASDFENFSTAVTQPVAGTDAAAEASIGLLTLTGDPSNSGLMIYANLDDAETGGSGPLDTTDVFNEVNDVEFTVTVDNTDGIDSVQGVALTASAME